MTVIGITGTQYQLDSKKMSDGGEGTIYRVLSGSAKTVAKIYKDGLTNRELEEKLKYMVDRQPSSSVLNQVAWPLDVIYDTNKQFLGFVMPMLSINAELGDIYKYPSQTDISAHQKLLIARNICVVIAEVHKAGYVFGDFNPRNIGVDKDNCTVAFLDTDSYHIIDNGQRLEYRCKVGCDGYIAPELLKSCDDFKANNPKEKDVYAKVTLPSFTKETDCFALAIHVFKLMMNGFTPFSGIAERASASQASPGIGNDAIRRNNYCFKPGLKPLAAAVPQLDAFTEDIADYFTRAFMVLGKIDPTQRPTAIEWRNALDKYINGLVTCVNNPLHQYDSKNGFCPYCKADLDYKDSLTPNKQVAYNPKTAPPVRVPASSSRTSGPYVVSRDNWWKRLSTGAKAAMIAASICVVVLCVGVLYGWFTGNAPVVPAYNPNDNVVMQGTNTPSPTQNQSAPRQRPSSTPSPAVNPSIAESQQQTKQTEPLQPPVNTQQEVVMQPPTQAPVETPTPTLQPEATQEPTQNTTKPPPTQPYTVPTGLTATGTSSTTINVSWNLVSSAVSYEVQANTNTSGSSGWYIDSDYKDKTATSYVSSGMTGDAYRFRVRAVSFEGGISDWVEVTYRKPVPSVPTGLTATGTGSTTINVSWNSVSSAVSYEVQASTNTSGSSGWYIDSDYKDKTATSYVSSGMTGDAYRFRVRAVSFEGGISDWVEVTYTK